MKHTFSLIVSTILFLAVACGSPEPAIQEVQVTRIIDRTVEVKVTVPVTRVIVQTEEKEVPVPVTRVVEQTVEVTREITKEIPITVIVTPTMPLVTPTPMPTNTPRPTATLRPTPTPTVSLKETTRANLWVYFTNDAERLAVYVDPAFDVDSFELDLFVDGKGYCNTARIYGDDGALEMSCEYESRQHSTVQRVSAQTPIGDLRCERNDASDSYETVYACAWR